MLFLMFLAIYISSRKNRDERFILTLSIFLGLAIVFSFIGFAIDVSLFSDKEETQIATPQRECKVWERVNCSGSERIYECEITAEIVNEGPYWLGEQTCEIKMTKEVCKEYD